MTATASMAVLQALADDVPGYCYEVLGPTSQDQVQVVRSWIDNGRWPMLEPVFTGTRDAAFKLLCRLANPKETP